MAASRFPDELLLKVLRHMMHENQVKIDSRAALSNDSFSPQPPPSSVDLCNFRLASKHFAELGSQQQFSHVMARLDQKWLDKLQEITDKPHLCQKVKKFTLKVLAFYPQDEQAFKPLLQTTRREMRETEETLRDAETMRERHDLERKLWSLQTEEKQIFDAMTRARDQHNIRNRQLDLRVLKLALASFTSLNHIRLLRLQDHVDLEWNDYLRRHRDLIPLFKPRWTSHGASVLGQAFLAAGCSARRFSSLCMEPNVPMPLSRNIEQSLTSIASRLTTMEIQFEFGGNHDIEERLLQLSPLFRTLFRVAVNIETIHIQFPESSKVSVPLETIFHDVTWEKVRVIGFAEWKLNSEEIIELIRRHRRSLRGLRIKEVLLKDGSRWDEVLRVLRLEVPDLRWLSLTGSDYAAWKESQAPIGVIVDDESDYESEGTTELDGSSYIDDNEGSYTGDDFEPAHMPIGNAFEHDTDSDHMELPEPVHHGMNDEQQDHQYKCICDSGYNDDDDLGDNGIFVTKEQRLFWQQWALRKCYIHDPEPLRRIQFNNTIS
ncbi:hypothetical protein BP5796_03189 [Coleophoma crateriformis]|uniref:Uncharacterized protein n=1 Tax=Coleophoma crateriformis TaxID=565419 RepID=A0A3D8SME7_9HELO|nr:hypothetical protein BP5796_03189 [Coleophoma crateriformis]